MEPLVSARPASAYDLIVIGGGAAGYFGAINAAEAKPGLRVLILEATARVLTKVKVSGGGRCNVTHQEFDPKRLVGHYPRGNKELLGPFHHFGPEATIRWFAAHGVALKTEADGRLFPTTDSSQTIIDALEAARLRSGVELLTRALVTAVEREDELFKLTLKDGRTFFAHSLLMASGSMPQGWALLEALGHPLVAPVPSLFTFEIRDPLLAELAGQSFPAIRAELCVEGHKGSWVQEGAALITHWGLSGPAILRLSAFAARELAGTDYQAKLLVQWSRDTDFQRALEDLLRAKDQHAKKKLASENPWPCSRRFWERLLELAALDPAKTWAQLSKKEAEQIALRYARSELSIHGKGVFKEEFVTAGGVVRADVDFRSMESRRVPGLYFAGEVLDVDGVTGGFNFQNAWTGSWLAAQHIARRCR